MSKMRCTITSAEGALFEGEVKMVTASGEQGDLGVMPGHTALLSTIVPGPVRLQTTDDKEEIFYLSGGFIEVQPDYVCILSDTALRSEDLQEESLKQAREAAQEAIKNRGDDFDYAQATAHLAQVTAQLRTLKQIRKKINK